MADILYFLFAIVELCYDLRESYVKYVKRKKRKNRAEKQGKKIENKSWNESEKKIQYYLTLGSVKKDEQGEINERQEEKNGGQKECRTQKIGTSAQL